jgi:hypothetical protein
LVPNIAKGKFARYAALPETNDALIWVILKASGLESDATLRDYDDLAAILAAANDEETATGYARVTATGVTVTVDDPNDRVDVDCADPSWTTTGALASGKIVCCYDNDTTAGTDSSLVPLFMDDFVVALTGTVTYQVAASGFARAS